MAKVLIDSGICGYTTTAAGKLQDGVCKLEIHSDCPAIERLGAELTEVDPYQEISFRRSMPRTYELGMKHCTHAACPVPAGIIKVIEVASGLALPQDAMIKFIAED